MLCGEVQPGLGHGFLRIYGFCGFCGVSVTKSVVGLYIHSRSPFRFASLADTRAEIHPMNAGRCTCAKTRKVETLDRYLGTSRMDGPELYCIALACVCFAFESWTCPDTCPTMLVKNILDRAVIIKVRHLGIKRSSGSSSGYIPTYSVIRSHPAPVVRLEQGPRPAA